MAVDSLVTELMEAARLDNGLLGLDPVSNIWTLVSDGRGGEPVPPAQLESAIAETVAVLFPDDEPGWRSRRAVLQWVLGIEGRLGSVDYRQKRARRAHNEVTDRPVADWENFKKEDRALRKHYLKPLAEELLGLRELPASEEDLSTRSLSRSEVARALDGEGLVKTVKSLYPEWPLVSLWGTELPIWARYADPGLSNGLNAALGELSGNCLPRPNEWPSDGRFGWLARDRFLSILETAESAAEGSHRLHSGAAYVLERLDRESGQMDLRHGRYFASLATSEALDEELMRKLAERSDAFVPLGRLPRRKFVHDAAGKEDPVEAGRCRESAASHACVVALRTTGNDSDFKILLPSRSADVRTHPGMRHIAPSGILSPHVEALRPDPRNLNVQWNFEREWAEELFGRSNAEVPNPLVDVAQDPANSFREVRVLRDGIEDGSVLGPYFTGVSMNLLTLRPEICMLMVVEDEQWLFGQEGLQLNWEYSTDPHAANAGAESAHPWLSIKDGKPVDEGELRRSDLVPNGGAAIALALPLLAELSSGDARATS